MERDLGAFRQVVQNIRLEAAQDERGDDAPQPGTRIEVLVALDRFGKVGAESLLRAQESRVQETEQRVQVHQVVLDGRAGGDDAEIRAQPFGGACPLGGGILDRLRFVEHRAVPVDVRQPADVVLQ